MTFLSIVAMLLGFGLVVFWHELGHFLGARWAGVRVEQFAVGMGHAIVSYRRGIGLRLGSTQKEFERRTDEEFERRQGGAPLRVKADDLSLPERYAIARDLGLGETEYRLSMLPIGGYVKPTGQDDLRPTHVAAADDPYSYAAAPVGKRMVIISAGVIMNVILAGILFFVLFRFVGFNVTQSMVGNVQSGSPAAIAGLQAGDELLEIDGSTLHDFTKVLMNVALLPGDRSVDLKIRRDGVEKTIPVHARATADNNDSLALGIGAPYLLVGRPAAEYDPKDLEKLKASTDAKLLPGETVTAIDGVPVDRTDFDALDRALQVSFNRPVALTITDADGKVREQAVKALFASGFNGQPLRFLGATPRVRLGDLSEKSSAAGKLQEGDVILRMTAGKTTIDSPSPAQFVETTRAAGSDETSMSFVVLRDGKPIDVADVHATTKIAKGRYGLGVGVTLASDEAVIGDVEKDSAFDKAGVKRGTQIVRVAGKPVGSWPEIHEALLARPADAKEPIEVVVNDGSDRVVQVSPSVDEMQAIRLIRYGVPLIGTDDLKIKRETTSSLTALGWGVTETRDLILQGYLMLKRIAYNRTVPASNLSGPVGILQAGSRLAQRGPDWFIWFLAVISANLAVVNFLPIPILDGWHFLALVKEKLTGKPVSERAQEVAQWVGLSLILSLLVFVTYNDIMRF